MLSNDSDPNGDSITIQSVTQPSHGTATINAAKTAVTYAAHPLFIGATTFTYTVTDGKNTATATVTVTIGSTFSPPVILP